MPIRSVSQKRTRKRTTLRAAAGSSSPDVTCGVGITRSKDRKRTPGYAVRREGQAHPAARVVGAGGGGSRSAALAMGGVRRDGDLRRVASALGADREHGGALG